MNNGKDFYLDFELELLESEKQVKAGIAFIFNDVRSALICSLDRNQA